MNRALNGITLLSTRAVGQANELAELVAAHGGKTILCPLIVIQGLKEEGDLSQVRQTFQKLTDYHWLVFTSSNGVFHFWRELQRNGVNISAVRNAQIAAIGPRTAKAIGEIGLPVDFVADSYEQEGLYREIAPYVKRGQKVLMPKARKTRDYLPGKLRELGAFVKELTVYETVPAVINTQDTAVPDLLALLAANKIDVVTFTSSSTVQSFFTNMRQRGVPDPASLLRGVDIACIGPITEQTAHRLGLTGAYHGKESTIRSMLEAIIRRRGASTQL